MKKSKASKVGTRQLDQLTEERLKDALRCWIRYSTKHKGRLASLGLKKDVELGADLFSREHPAIGSLPP